VLGDGSVERKKNGTNYITYVTVSAQLADDMQEMVWKAGYYPSLSSHKWAAMQSEIYTVQWNSKKRMTKRIMFEPEKGKSCGISKEHYTGKVYCLVTPSGFFVTRYNGKISIHGNSIADRHILPKEIWKVGNEKLLPNKTKLKAFRNLIRDAEDQPKFTLVTHYAVNYEIVGATGKFPQLSTEFEWV
jgi:hypothetical protein